MDSTDARGAVSAAYLLTALCARAEGHAAFDAALLDAASRFTEWDALPQMAEVHGMAPLVYHHLTRVGAPIPTETKRILQGQFLREKHASMIYTRQLARVMTAFHEAGIESLTLKGTPLAHLVYPEPYLRPRTDIDILVHESDVSRSVDVLQELGFSSGFTVTADHLPRRHLPPMSIMDDGVSVSIELHHWDGQADNNTPRRAFWYPVFGEYPGFDAPPVTFTIGEAAVTSPGYEALLRALNKHLVRHLLKATGEGVRLIWLADLVSLAERRAAEIDWDHLRRVDPAVLERLAVCYSVTPPPPDLPIPVRPARRPSGVGRYYDGWPHRPLPGSESGGLLTLLRETFAPSAWWAALYYGAGGRRSLLLTRWVWHPLQIGVVIVQQLWARITRR